MIRKPTWIFLGIFAVLLAGVYFWQRNQTQKAAEVTPTASAAKGYLFDIQGPINSVRIERVGDKQLEMKLDNEGKWQITWPTGLDTDSDAAASSLAQVATLPVVTRLAGASDLASMGLDQPSFRLQVTSQDGKSWVANIGKVTPTNSGYYVLSSDRTLYVVSKYALDAILGLVDAPPVKQSTPVPAPAETQPAAAGTTPTP